LETMLAHKYAGLDGHQKGRVTATHSSKGFQQPFLDLLKRRIAPVIYCNKPGAKNLATAAILWKSLLLRYADHFINAMSQHLVISDTVIKHCRIIEGMGET